MKKIFVLAAVVILNIFFFQLDRALAVDVQAPTSKLSLSIQIDPSKNEVHGAATYDFLEQRTELPFEIHHGAKVAANSPSTTLRLDSSGAVDKYTMISAVPTRRLSILFSNTDTEFIQEQGVQLLSDSQWYPQVNELVSFETDITLPEGWRGLTNGISAQAKKYHDSYRGLGFANDINLVANRFFEDTTRMEDGTVVRIWLVKNEPAIAKRYLDLAPQYISRYAKLIGPFPFSTFTIMENTFQTGLAFQGFTLLGSQVIRYPFILRSSLPHEILHSWWGNSVTVDYSTGNWCEGLTTYMADLAFQAEDGKGDEYRRRALQGYQDFALHSSDFPIRKFVTRNDRGTQAVGYGKSMMGFQMLENYLGSSVFYKALSHFYSDFRFKRAARFTDLQRSFEQESRKKLSRFFTTWLDQAGAPVVSLDQVKYKNGHLKFSVHQKGMVLPAMLPLKTQITFKDGVTQDVSVLLNSLSLKYDLLVSQAPAKISIDPHFNVFRQLYKEEAPPSLSKVFGEKSLVTISVPFGTKVDFSKWIVGIKDIYSENGHVQIQVVEDNQPLPQAGVLWVLGARNEHAKNIKSKLLSRGFGEDEKGLNYLDKNTWKTGNGTVFMTDQSKVDTGELLTTWIWTQAQQSGDVLTAKISHYPNYSAVGFDGVNNNFTMNWPLGNSPLDYILEN